MNKSIILIITTLFSGINLLSQGDEFLVTKLKKHGEPVKTVCFSPDSEFLLSGGEDKTVFLWETTNFEVVAEFNENYRLIQSCGFTKHGNNIVYSDGNAIKVITTEFHEPVITITAKSTDIWSFDLNTNNRKIVTGSYGKDVKVHSLTTGEEIMELEGHSKSALAVAYSPASKWIASGSLDKSIIIWDADSGKQVKQFTGHGGNIYDVDFVPGKEDYLLSASLDKSLRLWNVSAEKSIQTYIGHDEGIVSIDITSDGLHVGSGSYDETIKIWEIATGNEVYTIDAGAPVNSVSISPDRTMLAAALQNNEIKIWKLDPYIFVEERFGNEINNIIYESDLFRDREKDESRDEYKEREAKAAGFKKDLYLQFYQKYLEILQAIEFPN